MGNTAQQCRLRLFQDSDFAGDLEDTTSTSGGVLCIIFGSHTFVPVSWMCKKQTSVSHGSTEAEIISLDAGLRMDGIPALDLWKLVIEVFHYVPNVIFSQSIAMSYVFEDNEAVIKMRIKGRSPTTRHVSRTHRVALDWLFNMINLDPKNSNPLH